MKVTVFSTPTCPKCKVLKTKLSAAGVEYDVVDDPEKVRAEGIMSVPVLDVDGERYNFAEANKWVNERR